MGRYSNQPTSSDESGEDYTRMLLEEAALFDTVDFSPVEYLPQPEADDGIPTACYCGGAPVVGTSHTSKNPGRRYITCPNADDGDCHIWKWLDVALVEEVNDCHSQIRQIRAQGNESEQKVVNLEKTVVELAKNKAVVTKGFALVLAGMVCVLLLLCMVRQELVEMTLGFLEQRRPWRRRFIEDGGGNGAMGRRWKQREFLSGRRR